jgi:hypothetical protein
VHKTAVESDPGAFAVESVEATAPMKRLRQKVGALSVQAEPKVLTLRELKGTRRRQ